MGSLVFCNVYAVMFTVHCDLQLQMCKCEVFDQLWIKDAKQNK